MRPVQNRAHCTVAKPFETGWQSKSGFPGESSMRQQTARYTKLAPGVHTHEKKRSSCSFYQRRSTQKTQNNDTVTTVFRVASQMVLSRVLSSYLRGVDHSHDACSPINTRNHKPEFSISVLISFRLQVRKPSICGGVLLD